MKPLLITLALLNGADSVTTSRALAAGGREVLIPSQQPIVIGSVIVAETAVEAYGLTRLTLTHPKMANVLGWSLVAARGVVVASNLRQLHNAHR